MFKHHPLNSIKRSAERQADEEAPVEEFSGSDSDGDATASGLLHRSGLRLRR